MIYAVISLLILNLIISGFIIYYLRKHKRANDESVIELNAGIDEAYKRIYIINNALPRTSKEGSLGYKVSLKSE